MNREKQATINEIIHEAIDNHMNTSIDIDVNDILTMQNNVQNYLAKKIYHLQENIKEIEIEKLLLVNQVNYLKNINNY